VLTAECAYAPACLVVVWTDPLVDWPNSLSAAVVPPFSKPEKNLTAAHAGVATSNKSMRNLLITTIRQGNCVIFSSSGCAANVYL
jgi:hypothetical protein